MSETRIGKLIQLLPRIDNPIQRRMVMQEAYEETFGIHDYSQPNASPLDLVTVKKKEVMWKHSNYANTIERFINLKISDHVSLIDFLSLPRHMCEHVVDVVERKIHAEAAKTKEVIDGKK